MRNRFINPAFVIALLVGSIIFLSSCDKDELFDKPVSLSFSQDTLLFDTIFTTIGSSTQTLKIFNPKDQDIEIDHIHLGLGDKSPFRINVNGLSGVSFNNIDLAARDSLFLFAEVTIDPSSNDQPMIVTDSIVFNTNGKVQNIKLVAWGQDAIFIVADQHISGLPPYKIVAKEGEDISWDSPKPYVIYGYAVVDSTARLNIPEGARIHFHANSGLWVYKGGQINVNGTALNPVVFQDDRPEDYYDDIAGQWDRIWINEGSMDNVIEHAIIKNGFIGIQAETLNAPMGNQLTMRNVFIRNMAGIGILGRNYQIEGENIEVANTGNYAVALTNGGNYDFRHMSIANYWSDAIRQTPSLYLNNFFEANDGSIRSNDLDVYFGNTIVYGNQPNEFLAEDIKDGSLFNYSFDHCLVKTDTTTTSSNWINCIINQDPDFTDVNSQDFSLQQNSPAINNGNTSITIPYDINNNPRDAQPDIGAHEYTP